MKHNHEYQQEFPDIFRDEIDRAFGEILQQQVQNHQHQYYILSLGNPIVSNIRLKFRTPPSTPESKINPSKKKKFFSLEFTPDIKHGLAFLDLIMYLKSDTFRNYYVSKNQQGRRGSSMSAPWNGDISEQSKSVYSISWEFLESELPAYILGILKEIGQTICRCRARIEQKKIGYLSGNLLSKNQKIPVNQPKIPAIKNGVVLDIYRTLEERKMITRRSSPSYFRNGQYRHPETAYILEKIRDKSKLLLALRDPSYTDETQKEQLIADYEQAWWIILPNEVCRLIMSHGENDGFEFELWHKNLDPIYLRVGELNQKEQERVIGFWISVIDKDADMLWDELAENFKKYNDEIGDYEFEVTHHNDADPENTGKATIVVEMPISFQQPEKIRNMFILIGTLLFQHGYEITRSPQINNDFDNPKGKLQSIAKKALRQPKINPSSDR